MAEQVASRFAVGFCVVQLWCSLSGAPENLAILDVDLRLEET